MKHIRRFAPGDETALAALIRRAFYEVNIRDYPREGLAYWAELYTPAHVRELSGRAHTYVMEEDGALLGTCSIGWKTAREAHIEALYVLPDRLGEGIASLLLASCERDADFRGAARIWVDSSVTARAFYEKRGYRHESGAPVCVENDHYVMYKENETKRKDKKDMNEVLEFLRKAGAFYLATVDGDQPRVRPFGAACEFGGKLYLTTANKKDVYRQLKKNGKVEVCAMCGEQWMRIAGELVEDDDRAARVAMLEANPSIQSLYNADDNLMTVLYFKSATATLYSFTAAPVVYRF